MKIAITGGIGSGKSFVCRMLEARGIRIYDCDEGAKRVMRSDDEVIGHLCRLVGSQVYEGHTLQKPVLAKFLLQSEAHKQAVNEIVHPAVARDFAQSGLDWLESAILFESGFDKRVGFDLVVAVTCPDGIRRARIMERDHIGVEKAQQWIDAQMPQEVVAGKAGFVIVNDGKADLAPQVDRLLSLLAAKGGNRSCRIQESDAQGKKTETSTQTNNK